MPVELLPHIKQEARTFETFSCSIFDSERETKVLRKKTQVDFVRLSYKKNLQVVEKRRTSFNKHRLKVLEC